MRKFLTHLKDTSTNQTRDQVLIVTHLCKAYNEGFDACSGNSNGNDNSGSSDNLNLNSNDNSGQSSNSGSGSHSGLVDKGCNLINKHPAAATFTGTCVGPWASWYTSRRILWTKIGNTPFSGKYISYGSSTDFDKCNMGSPTWFGTLRYHALTTIIFNCIYMLVLGVVAHIIWAGTDPSRFDCSNGISVD
jgi:hypothetical protein